MRITKFAVFAVKDPMEGDRNINIKEIVTARFQNPKFVYDGKRVQPVYERRIWDYASALTYNRHMQPPHGFYDPRFDLSSQILSLKTPALCNPYETITDTFAHMSINKIRSPVNVIIWNPDGRRLLSGSTSGEITMWNGFSFNFDTILQAHESPIRSMCWSPSSSFLLTSDNLGYIKYWHPSMNNIQVISAHTEGIKDLSFSFNDLHFCSASDDSTVKIWDSSRGECERVLRGHNWDVRRAQWHPNLALIASGGKDNLMKLWDPRQETPLTTFHYHKNTILTLKFYKDNWILSGGKDQVVKMLDLRTMKECFTYKNKNKDVCALAIHPFSGMFSTGTADGLIYFWDPFVEEPIGVSSQTHEGVIWSLEFHPVGHVLASGSSDSMIKFWIRKRPGDLVTDETLPQSDEDSSSFAEDMAIPGLS